MKVDPLVDRLEHFLADRLDDGERADLDAYLAAEPVRATEAHELRASWDELARDPDPVPAAGPADPAARFAAVLAGYRAGIDAHRELRRRGWPVAVAAVVIAGLGLVGGLLAGREEIDPGRAPTEHRVSELEARLALAQLAAPHAVDRLAGVVACEGLVAHSEEVFTALIAMLATDASDNLRLAAIDALRPGLAERGFAPALGEALAADGPLLVRIALIDLAVEAGDRASRETLRRIRDARQEPEMLRAEARWALSNL